MTPFFPAPTKPQLQGWPAIARGESTLILAPTGTGKTLAAFLWCINRLMFAPIPAKEQRCRVLYISPIKALAVDVERNLRAPLVGIAQAARRLGAEFHEPQVAIRTGDTPAAERARFLRHPADILITTPESLYLLLTSNAREALRSDRNRGHRRDSCAGSGQARLASRALPGTPGTSVRAATAAHRALRHAAAAGRSGAITSAAWQVAHGDARMRFGSEARDTESRAEFARLSGNEAAAVATVRSPSSMPASPSGSICASKFPSKT